MDYYNVFEVNDKNKLKCSFEDTSNLSGTLECTKYTDTNKTINYGIDYYEGKLYQKTQDVLPLNYEFNSLHFANIIEKGKDIENVNQCFNLNNCINKELYAKKQLKTNQMTNTNFFDYCNDQKICETNNDNYKNNNKYLLKKFCFNNNCYYNLYCGCEKNNI
jgi:hypothetical protein